MPSRRCPPHHHWRGQSRRVQARRQRRRGGQPQTRARSGLIPGLGHPCTGSLRLGSLALPCLLLRLSRRQPGLLLGRGRLGCLGGPRLGLFHRPRRLRPRVGRRPLRGHRLLLRCGRRVLRVLRPLDALRRLRLRRLRRGGRRSLCRPRRRLRLLGPPDPLLRSRYQLQSSVLGVALGVGAQLPRTRGALQALELGAQLYPLLLPRRALCLDHARFDQHAALLHGRAQVARGVDQGMELELPLAGRIVGCGQRGRQRCAQTQQGQHAPNLCAKLALHGAKPGALAVHPPHLRGEPASTLLRLPQLCAQVTQSTIGTAELTPHLLVIVTH